MNTESRATHEFRVSYSSGRPPGPGQPINNTFGLAGEGKLSVRDGALILEGQRSGFYFGGPPRIKLEDVANVDYNASARAFLIRTRSGQHYVIVWLFSSEEAEALWALLPQEKTADFVQDQEEHRRFGKAMAVLGAKALVTPSIIALNVAVFIIMLAAGADLTDPNPAIHIRFGSNFGPLTWTGEEWRLLTSAFLHFGILHLALNMYSLYQAGGLVERLFGSTRFALIYLLSALAGSVVSGWWDPLRNSAGASGAIFGVLGALLAFMVVRGADFPRSLLKSIAVSTLMFGSFSLVLGAAHPLIDNACHVGGLLGGFVTGLVLARPFNVESRAVRQPARLVVAVLIVGLPLAWMAQSLLAPTGPQAPALQFSRALYDFFPVEATLARKHADILTFRPDVRVNRLEIAQRLRKEVLLPWRNASRPLMVSAQIPDAESHSGKLQKAWREYVSSREAAVSLRALALESGNPTDLQQAESAEARLTRALNDLNTLGAE